MRIRDPLGSGVPGLLAAVLAVGALAQPAHAQLGDVYEPYDSVGVSECGSKAYAGAQSFIQVRYRDGQWANGIRVKVDRKGCVRTEIDPASMVPSDVTQVAVRVNVPKQRQGSRTLKGWHSQEKAYRVWPEPSSLRDPIPHLDAFAERYGASVVTILCPGPSGIAQGTGVVTSVILADTELASSTVATAGHVVRDCNYYDPIGTVQVVAQGSAYPGQVLRASEFPDLAWIRVEGTLPAAQMAQGPELRPSSGDAAAAIGTAGGIAMTTTSGEIVGVSEYELNTTVPSGHGASGGPVFNNRGQVVGLVVAGNGSLTVATALPAFCSDGYWLINCTQPVWP